jgi:1,4-dihydroxy-2-naphthoate octaprenyltransferase
MLEGQMLERSICFPGATFVRRVAPQGISGKEKSRLTPMASLFDWIAAARPKTLGAAIAPVLVGWALAAKVKGSADVKLALCTLGSCMALQIATNFFNDALDSLKGADTRSRIGPRRITASGQAPAGMVKFAAVLMLGVAAVLALPLFELRGLPIRYSISVLLLWLHWWSCSSGLSWTRRALCDSFLRFGGGHWHGFCADR